VYGIQGGLAGVAALTFMASVDAAEPSAGLSTEWMEAIAAPILGGNRLSGGRARIFGMVIGTLILSTIRSGLNVIRVAPAFQQIAIGLVLVVAVIVDTLRFRQRLSLK
jgi:ribose/xylose/arabinose/galactoside ABC-type transport system permease subunit